LNASVEVSDYMGWLFLTYSRDSINKLSKTNRYKNVCPLHVACAMGNLEVADYLIENGSDINTEIIPNFISSTGIGKGYTPLYLALSNENKTLLHYF
jgi:ankyrin repeat protein